MWYMKDYLETQQIFISGVSVSRGEWHVNKQPGWLRPTLSVDYTIQLTLGLGL